MGKAVLKICLIAAAFYTPFCGALVERCVAEPMDTGSTAVKQFLRAYLEPSGGKADTTTRYVAALAALSGNKNPEVIVHLQGRSWCGSGGCQTLILSPEGKSFRVINTISIVHLPIRVLESDTKGWHDLGVWVQGGGIQPGYEALLPFNGKKYPSNPSVSPARQLFRSMPGKAVIPAEAEGIRLYE